MSVEERTVSAHGTPYKSDRTSREVRRAVPPPEPRITVYSLIEKYQSPEKWREIDGRPVAARLVVLRRVSLDNRLVLWVTDNSEVFVELRTTTVNEQLLKEYQTIAAGDVIDVVAIARAFDDGPGFDEARIVAR
jgi:hypothetical protein